MKIGYKVQDIMTNMPVKIGKNTSVVEAAQMMDKFNVNSLLVVEEKPEGIVTDEDFVRKLVAKGKMSEETIVEEIMSKNLVTIQPEKDIYEAIVMMRDNNIRQLPVLDGEKLVGFLTMKDILKIQPELFDIVVESINLREEDRKMKSLEMDDSEI